MHMAFAILSVFIAGYALIALEHVVKINKAATALLTGVLCWTVYVSLSPGGAETGAHLPAQVADIAGILFFLMGAMTIVEIIDAHGGFDMVTAILSGGSKRRLLWLAGVTGFFLSAVLDNLTTTIVMVSLLSKILPKREDLLIFTGMVVIAVNAGGAWTPIGDVTTTMLWIGGRITSLSIMKILIAPCVVCAGLPLLWESLRMKDGNEKIVSPKPGVMTPREKSLGRAVFFLGIGVLLFVPVFKTVTHLPPFIGMIFGLGVLWIVTEILHGNGDAEKRHAHSVARALQRIDMPSILFFLGILLGISALQAAGVLPALAQWLDRRIGDIHVTVLAIGLISAVVDNVPLVAGAMKMYSLSQFGVDHHFWSFLSYCAGTGGSALIIGSAAGVAAMGMAKMDFVWYVKRITPMALLGYAAGAAVYMVQGKFF
jgi:Na+/H+ antiporter NhaD/arsenite permease-like protein